MFVFLSKSVRNACLIDRERNLLIFFSNHYWFDRSVMSRQDRLYVCLAGKSKSLCFFLFFSSSSSSPFFPFFSIRRTAHAFHMSSSQRGRREREERQWRNGEKFSVSLIESLRRRAEGTMSTWEMHSEEEKKLKGTREESCDFTVLFLLSLFVRKRKWFPILTYLRLGTVDFPTWEKWVNRSRLSLMIFFSCLFVFLFFSFLSFSFLDADYIASHPVH